MLQICIPTRKSDPAERVMAFGHEHFSRDNPYLISKMANATAAEKQRRKQKRAFMAQATARVGTEGGGEGVSDQEKHRNVAQKVERVKEKETTPTGGTAKSPASSHHHHKQVRGLRRVDRRNNERRMQRHC